ncbi:hypothetical protein ACOSQ2_003262 [Xanthoceras sorbifolium]
MEGRSERRAAAYDLTSKNRDNHERIMTSTARRRAKPAGYIIMITETFSLFGRLCLPGDQLCDELEGIKNALAWAGRIDSKIGVSGIAWNANNIGNVGSIIFLLAGGGTA